jgi:hypothetical protein
VRLPFVFNDFTACGFERSESKGDNPVKKTLFAFSATLALTALAQIGSAESVLAKMKVEVPVAFRTHNAALSQGPYRITVRSLNGAGSMVTFTNLATNRGVMASALRSKVADGDPPTIRLQCADGECDVASITYRGTRWTFAPRKLTPEQIRRLYTMAVPMEVTRPAD